MFCFLNRPSTSPSVFVPWALPLLYRCWRMLAPTDELFRVYQLLQLFSFPTTCLGSTFLGLPTEFLATGPFAFQLPKHDCFSSSLVFVLVGFSIFIMNIYIYIYIYIYKHIHTIKLAILTISIVQFRLLTTFVSLCHHHHPPPVLLPQVETTTQTTLHFSFPIAHGTPVLSL